MQILDWKKLSEKIKLELKNKIENEKIFSHIWVILIWKNPASELYVKYKEKFSKEIWVKFTKFLYDEKISEKIDIVDVFRPSKETPGFAEEAVKIGAKTFWLQYGIQNEEAKKISEGANIKYIENKCIKQEYQKLFQKSNPVFPV